MPRSPRALRFPLAVDHDARRLREETDYDRYVDQLVRQLLLTSPGERVNRPDFGAGIRRLLFAPSNEATATPLQTTILAALERWLAPVLTVEAVDVELGHELVVVTVRYVVRRRGAGFGRPGSAGGFRQSSRVEVR
ncbi:MAG: GPW/gp25 family protein [Myxococcales bacterium]|nr:GPW/gp25 family protein [Myxococcales bacterium]